MSRVLVVQKFAPPGSPQDQQRGTIFEPLFRGAGIDVRYIARYPPWAMGRRQSPFRQSQPQSPDQRSRASSGARSLFDAIGDPRIVRAARGVDVVLLIKADSPALIRALRRGTRARLVYDLADIRRHDPIESATLDFIAANVDAIAVDNEAALAHVAKRFRTPAYRVPPTAYVEQFDERRSESRRGRDGRTVIGWIGTPGTTPNLYLVLNALEEVFRSRPGLELRLIGAPAMHELFGRFERVRYSTRPSYDSSGMIEEVLGMDIGIFPQYDLEHSAMHGTTKANVYMGGGAAVVASPVGDCVTLIRDGDNGMLARDRAEWTAKLGALADDALLRDRLSAVGLRTAREQNSLEACFAALRVALGV